MQACVPRTVSVTEAVRQWFQLRLKCEAVNLPLCYFTKAMKANTSYVCCFELRYSQRMLRVESRGFVQRWAATHTHVKVWWPGFVMPVLEQNSVVMPSFWPQFLSVRYQSCKLTLLLFCKLLCLPWCSKCPTVYWLYLYNIQVFTLKPMTSLRLLFMVVNCSPLACGSPQHLYLAGIIMYVLLLLL